MLIDRADVSAYLEDAARGRNAWWAYLAAILVAVGILWLLGLGTGAALRALSVVPGNDGGEAFLQGHPLVFLAIAGILAVILVFAFTIAAWLIQRKSFADIVGRWDWRRFWWGAGVWTILSIASALIDFAIAPHSFKLSVSAATASLAAAALVAITAQSFSEEFVFRGYLTQAFMLATKQPIVAALITGLVFGALHIPNGTPMAVDAAFYGVVAALIAVRTRSIALTSGLHIVNNLFGAVIVVSSIDVFRGMPGVFEYSAPSLLWVDTGVDVLSLVFVAWLVLRRPSAAAS